MSGPSVAHCLATASRVLLCAVLAATAVPAAADSGSMAVSAVVLSKNKCTFTSGAATLAFGEIDPTAGSDVTATASASFVCRGKDSNASFAISADGGSHPSGGSPRMQHGVDLTQFLPYSLALSPATGSAKRNIAQTLTLTGTITPAQFGDAVAGAYSDTVEITVVP